MVNSREEFGQDDPYNFPKFFFRNFGFKPSVRSFVRLVTVYVALPLLCVIWCLSTLQLHAVNDITGFVKTFESILTFSQIILRKVIMIRSGKEFEELLKSRENFQPLNQFGNGDKHKKYLILASTSMKRLLVLCFLVFIFVSINPIFDEEETPFVTWLPSNPILIKIIYFLQSLFFLELVLLGCVFDTFLILFCVDLEIQFNVLKEFVDSIVFSEEGCVEKLKECCLCHLVVLRFQKKVEKIYSEYFFCQYLFNIGCICIQFAILREDSIDLSPLLRSITYTLGVLLQGVFTIVAASNVDIGANNFANSIFETDWYNSKSIEAQKLILFMLMKAQEPVEMSAAGFFTVNRNVCVQIPKISFSISTILSGRQ